MEDHSKPVSISICPYLTSRGDPVGDHMRLPLTDTGKLQTIHCMASAFKE